MRRDGELSFPLPVAVAPLERVICADFGLDLAVVITPRAGNIPGLLALAFSLNATDFEPQWVQATELDSDKMAAD